MRSLKIRVVVCDRCLEMLGCDRFLGFRCAIVFGILGERSFFGMLECDSASADLSVRCLGMLGCDRLLGMLGVRLFKIGVVCDRCSCRFKYETQQHWKED
ncbi:hypothetical protein VB711_25305 [Cronbergia sp. UHCC 0137]|uniref:hypothetical protein n=1 Tax=Cronbergia sp. UHCC 0137 TaxID=3110239 RepID=UPI002B20669E|nr:hypothetical protein [Cronbergia sp. UHCC 0137]MEA5621126.1 hypothetical protein [Cronbergia sp. UHCC 0137]